MAKSTPESAPAVINAPGIPNCEYERASRQRAEEAAEKLFGSPEALQNKEMVTANLSKLVQQIRIDTLLE